MKAAASKEDLLSAQADIDKILIEKNCGPLFVRLAWHDSATFDANLDVEWPGAGGAVGSIRFEPEINHAANVKLDSAVALLEPVKTANPNVSYSDIFQMSSARAIELAGGPKIDMIYGRVDVTSAEDCSPEGNLGDAEPNPETGKYGGKGGTASTEADTPNGHLRKVFYRMGLNDEDIVALSGAHTYGRAYKDRSGLGAESTKYTDGKSPTAKQILTDGKEAKYRPGGSSWTPQFLVFDNSYFEYLYDKSADEELLKLSSDKTLFDDEDFKVFAEKFRLSQEDFFESYKKSHKKLSELGSKFEPEGGISLD